MGNLLGKVYPVDWTQATLNSLAEAGRELLVLNASGAAGRLG